jgi:glycosyltransferase involved in cell wall biosynthesis
LHLPTEELENIYNMKIAIDGTPMIHGSRAVKRHCKNLLQSMTKLYTNHEYKLLYIDRRKQPEHYATLNQGCHFKDYGVRIPGRILQAGWKYLNLPPCEWLIGNFDIFYATDLYFPPSTQGTILGTVHGLAYYIIEDMLIPEEVSLLKKGLNYTLKNADYLLAVSDSTRDELIRYLKVDERRIYVVNHGVDPHFKILNDRKKLMTRLHNSFGISEPYILFVGVIGHHKNIIGLMKSYEILREYGVKLPLVLAGPPGSASMEVQAWIKNKGWENCVITVGPIDQSNGELRDLYNGASVFVFPSFYEGWTAPPIEAMACGVPVLASNCSSIPQTVGDAAIKIDPNNAKEWADQIDKVLSDTSLKSKLIKKGLAHAKSHTWEKAAMEMVAVFKDIKLRGPWIEKR